MLGEGQFFGEIAVLKNARRNATVRAIDARTQLLVLDAGDLSTLMTKRPDIAERVRRGRPHGAEMEKETVRTVSPSRDCRGLGGSGPASLDQAAIAFFRFSSILSRKPVVDSHF